MRLLPVLLLCCLIALPCLAYERMAAWQDSLVEMADGFPYAALVTYDNSRPDQPMWLQQVTLGKLIVGLKVGEQVEWWKEAEVTVLPEGLVATGILGGTKLKLCLLPLMTDWRDLAWQGGALYELETSGLPAGAKLLLAWGGVSVDDVLLTDGRYRAIQEEGFPAAKGEEVPLSGDCVLIAQSGFEALVAAFRVPGASPAVATDLPGLPKLEGPVALVEMTPPSGKLSLLAAFAETEQAALVLASADPAAELAKTRSYYSSLVASAVCQDRKSVV